LTTAPHWPASLDAATFAGQVITHGVLLLTVTVNEQLATFWPDPFVALQVTAVVPSGNLDPDGGLQAIVTPEQFWVVGAGYVTTAPRYGLVFPSSVTTTLAEQVSVQGAAETVTTKLQLARTTFDPSFPAQFTVVEPTGKLEPDGGVQVTVRLGQPLGVGDEYVTVAEPEPGGFSEAKTSSGQIIMQTWLLTVTVKLQDSRVPELLVVWQFTVVVPTGKLDPDGGSQAAVGAEQLSGKAGAG
jgi:hypothetical protein